MKCREFEDRLNDLLDERHEPASDGRLADHAHGCLPCRQLLSDQRIVLATLKDDRPPQPAAGFAKRVVAKASPSVGRRRSTVPQRTWWALGTLLATAAAALLAVSLIWQAREGKLPLGGKSLAGKQPESRTPRVHQPNVAPNRGSRSEGLALGQADWLIEAPRLPSRIRGGYRGTIDNLAISLPETVQRLDEVEHYAPGIKPIRISLGVLFETLWRALPGTQDEDELPTRTSCLPWDPQRVA